MTEFTMGKWWSQLYQQGRLSQYLLLLACLAGVAGLLASRALVALSPVVGVVAAFANPDFRRDLPRWLRNGAAWRMALLYILLIISGLYTQDWPFWQHEVYRQLPFIGVPLAFALAVPLTPKQRFAVGCSFVLGIAAIAAATLGRYELHPVASRQLFDVGKNLPSITGIFHIHFSIMLGLAFYFGLLLSQTPRTGRLLRWALWAAAAVCVVVLHALAYRTGLLVFYIGLLFNGLRFIVVNRRFGLGLLTLAVFVLAPLGAYRFIPAVQERVGATRYDVEQFYQGSDINDFSISKRLAAWHTARIVAQEHPWLGVGPADAYQAMMAQYSWYSYGLRPANWVMIHNQYLHYLVGSGLIGLFLWLLVLLGPLIQPSQRRDPYVYHFLLIMGTAMLVDSLLEMQIGLNLFVFFYGFLIVATDHTAHQA